MARSDAIRGIGEALRVRVVPGGFVSAGAAEPIAAGRWSNWSWCQLELRRRSGQL